MGQKVSGVNKITEHEAEVSMDGKSQAWRTAADKLVEALAKENKYIVSDMVIIFLESAGYGLEDYSPLGGVFKRAAKKGIVTRVDRPSKQALWHSQIYDQRHSSDFAPILKKGQVVGFRNFPGGIDKVTFKIADITDNRLILERHP